MRESSRELNILNCMSTRCAIIMCWWYYCL